MRDWINKIKPVSREELNQLEKSIKKTIDDTTQSNIVEIKNLNQIINESEGSIKNHFNQIINESEISTKIHINKVITESEISMNAHINKVITESEISMKTHINKVITESEISMKTHINKVITESEISMKTHINQAITASGNTIQKEINCSSIAVTNDLKLRIDLFEESLKILIGQNIIRMRDNNNILSTVGAELRVFSQWGEDGIIQWIISKIIIENDVFLEFGVGDYKESNTRFLLINNNWTGFIIDSSKQAIDAIKSDPIYWKNNLKAECHFITTENINDIIRQMGLPKDIGLLSIDIDGNDYWVWQALDAISPRIIVCEYNSIFGSKHAITIPYDPDFDRTKAHFSNLYWGASLPALYQLAQKKGYVFIGSNRAGNNAFFVRSDLAEVFVPLSAEEGYVNSKYRESRDIEGRFSYISGKDRIRIIKNMPVIDLSDNIVRSINELEHDSMN